jgi:hypothetical protein
MRRVENRVKVKEMDIVSLNERGTGALPQNMISGESWSAVLDLD